MSIATLQIINNSLAALTARLDKIEARIAVIEAATRPAPVENSTNVVPAPKPILTLKRGVVA